jgi:hypothetical protein
VYFKSNIDGVCDTAGARKSAVGKFDVWEYIYMRTPCKKLHLHTRFCSRLFNAYMSVMHGKCIFPKVCPFNLQPVHEKYQLHVSKPFRRQRAPTTSLDVLLILGVVSRLARQHTLLDFLDYLFTLTINQNYPPSIRGLRMCPPIAFHNT